MVVAFGAREDLFDVVETADQAGAEGKAGGAEGTTGRLTTLQGIEPCPKDVVHDVLEGRLPSSLFTFESDRHVFLQCQCGAHIMMLLS